MHEQTNQTSHEVPTEQWLAACHIFEPKKGWKRQLSSMGPTVGSQQDGSDGVWEKYKDVENHPFIDHFPPKKTSMVIMVDIYRRFSMATFDDGRVNTMEEIWDVQWKAGRRTCPSASGPGLSFPSFHWSSGAVLAAAVCSVLRRRKGKLPRAQGFSYAVNDFATPRRDSGDLWWKTVVDFNTPWKEHEKHQVGINRRAPWNIYAYFY